MWRTHLAVGLRALRRDPLFAAINLFGLAVGLAACLLIILFIRYERSFDDWLLDADRVYQVQRIETTGTNAGTRYAQTSFVAAAVMPPQFPEIEKATGLIEMSGTFPPERRADRNRRRPWHRRQFSERHAASAGCRRSRDGTRRRRQHRSFRNRPRAVCSDGPTCSAGR